MKKTHRAIRLGATYEIRGIPFTLKAKGQRSTSGVWCSLESREGKRIEGPWSAKTGLITPTDGLSCLVERRKLVSVKALADASSLNGADDLAVELLAFAEKVRKGLKSSVRSGKGSVVFTLHQKGKRIAVRVTTDAPPEPAKGSRKARP